MSEQQVVLIMTGGRCGSIWLRYLYELHNGYYALSYDKNEITIENGLIIALDGTIPDKVVIHSHSVSYIPQIDRTKLKILWVSRHNKFEQMMSFYVLEHVDQRIQVATLDENQSESDTKFEVSPSVILHGIANIAEDEFLRYNTLMNGAYDYQRIYYEDLFSDKQEQIIQSLGLKKSQSVLPVKSQYQAKKLVSNYQEIMRELNVT